MGSNHDLRLGEAWPGRDRHGRARRGEARLGANLADAARTQSMWGPWWEDPALLAAVWRWLDYRGMQPDDPADFMEEPWHYTDCYAEMVACS